MFNEDVFLMSNSIFIYIIHFLIIIQIINSIPFTNSSNKSDPPEDKLTNLSPNLRNLEQIGLTYVRSFELKYASSFWSFKIEIVETLQENEQVVIDIVRANTKDTATCTYSSSILSCKDDTKGSTSNLVLIASQKESGTVSWKNLKEDTRIPFEVIMTYTSAFDLELVDNNKWKFLLQGSSSSTVYSNFLLTMNMIIRNNGEEERAIANCISNNTAYYKCEFETKKSDKNSLVFISSLKEQTSITWKNTLKYNGQVVRPATLHFVDAYDLFFSTTNKRWEFKIYDADGVTLRVDLKPCYRTADQVIGFYDTVSENFLTNAGSGNLIVGPDIN